MTQSKTRRTALPLHGRGVETILKLKGHPTEDHIRERACETSQSRRRAPLRELKNWRQAERDLEQEGAEKATPGTKHILRIVMVGNDCRLLPYVWRLTGFFLRRFPTAEYCWTHWSFADLENPITGAVAAGAGAVADWVVFCQATSAPLPPHVKSWLERCLAGQGESKATLGLLSLSKEGDGPGPIQSCLEEAAVRSGTGFVNVRDGLEAGAREQEREAPHHPTVEVPYD